MLRRVNKKKGSSLWGTLFKGPISASADRSTILKLLDYENIDYSRGNESSATSSASEKIKRKANFNRQNKLCTHRMSSDGWIGGINVVGLVHERSCLLCGEVGASADIASRMRVSRFVDKSTGIVY
jgi:hypothetical protein